MVTEREQQLEKRVAELEQLTKDMESAVVNMAITLLHQFGISGSEAEERVMGKIPSPASVQPKEYTGDAKAIRLMTTPSTDLRNYGEVWIKFDRLVPLGARIGEVHIDNHVLEGVVALQHTDDCVYLCSSERVYFGG